MSSLNITSKESLEEALALNNFMLTPRELTDLDFPVKVDAKEAEEARLRRETTLEVLHSLTIYIRSQGAEATPPLGTVLGNLGVNSIKFCKEFNEFTEELPSYITLGVSITVMENRSYSFTIISGPSMGHLLALLRYEASLLEKNQYVVRSCISLKAVIQLTLYKFPRVPLRMSFPMVVAVMHAASLTIIPCD